MRSRVLPLLLVLTACTGGSPERAASVSRSAPASAVPSAAPSPAAALSTPPGAPAGALMLAVAGQGQLALYEVAAGTHDARLVRRLEGPAGRTVASVSVASGPAPAVCAVWQKGPTDADTTSDLLCYRSEAARGRLTLRGEVRSVAVRADGRALAWTEYGTEAAFVIADLVGDVAKERSRDPYVESGSPEGGSPENLGDLTWLGPRTVGATDEADSDEGRGVCVIDVEKPRATGRGFGFGRCLQPDAGEGRKGYARFFDAVPAEDGAFVTVERAKWCCDFDPHSDPGARAVRVRLSDGAVLGLVATPRAGRDVVDVSGGPRAVVYLTRSRATGSGVVVSLRWSGDVLGAPVTGLPAGVTVVTAQP